MRDDLRDRSDWANDLVGDDVYESISGMVPRGGTKTVERDPVALEVEDDLETEDEYDMIVLIEPVGERVTEGGGGFAS